MPSLSHERANRPHRIVTIHRETPVTKSEMQQVAQAEILSTVVFDRDSNEACSCSSTPSHSSEEDKSYEEAQHHFEVSFPQFAEKKHVFENLRHTEFSKLDLQQCNYLDYTGSALPPQSLIDRHADYLRNSLLGNPHSAHQPSVRSSDLDRAARETLLKFCKADPSVYTVIWTANSSAALKLVGESFPFGKKGAFVYAPDCHNSALGMSAFARKQGAAIKGFKFGKNWSSSYDYDDLDETLDALTARRTRALCMPSLLQSRTSRTLLAFPAQSNVSGVKHDARRIIDSAHQRGWDVFMDAAALAPTSGVDLSEVQPEFVCMSFYKMFGYPTGIGCLVAKKSALAQLRRPWFAGGTVRAVSVQPDHLFHAAYDPSMHQCWEDGTINFQQTAAVKMGLEWLQSIGMASISTHTSSLIAWTSDALKRLRWSNGRPFCFIPNIEDGQQGSSVGMLVLTASGRLVPHKLLESKTAAAGLAVRTGCFCNPGTAYLMIGWHSAQHTDSDVLVEKFTKDFEAFTQVYKTLGLVRVSAGVATTFRDCYGFVRFLESEILAKSAVFEAEVAQFLATAETPYSFC